jgi:centrosomal protein CEP44
LAGKFNIKIKKMASAREQAAGTGDLKNNIIKLLREIHRMKLKVEPNHKGLCMGIPSSFLPILHAALMDYSLPLAKHIVNKGIKMYARTDLKFTEALYKVNRQPIKPTHPFHHYYFDNSFN